MVELQLPCHLRHKKGLNSWSILEESQGANSFMSLVLDLYLIHK